MLYIIDTHETVVWLLKIKKKHCLSITEEIAVFDWDDWLWLKSVMYLTSVQAEMFFNLQLAYKIFVYSDSAKLENIGGEHVRLNSGHN